MTDHLVLDDDAALGPDEVRAIADGASLRLSEALLTRLTESRGRTTAALADAGPVYGVTTGMGLASNLAVDAADRPAYQDDLMLARSVGVPPWLDLRTARAVLAVRLRTLLGPEVGITPDLARALTRLLESGAHPAIPSRGNGAAGEIIPLAHLGAFLTGAGDGVGPDGSPVPAAEALADAGAPPYRFAAKEGVAFLQGVPVATARAILLGEEARLLAGQGLATAAGSVALVGAPRDPYEPALDRADARLAEVHAALRALVGSEESPRMLQAPVSFRVVGPATAHLLRTLDRLDGSVRRELDAVSTSPALVDGRFLGTAGFDGFDLAASLDSVRVAVVHAAEVTAARLHRLLDPRVTGLRAQLSGEPGRQAGLVAVHKRAVGLLHEVRRAPASIGAAETSLGQEDVQAFALEAAAALDDALAVLRDVTACELLAVHRALLLDPDRPRGTPRLQMVLHKASEVLSNSITDRAFGRDVSALMHVLRVGWAHDVLHTTREVPSQPSSEAP